VESAAGKYKGWYRITGPTGFDICQSNLTDSLYGRNRTQMPLTENYYTVETLGRTGDANYKWEIKTDETSAASFSLDSDVASATVGLKFDGSILSKNSLVNKPTVAETIVLQCTVQDAGGEYTLLRKITVGDRDECSPAAKLKDAEGNEYTVSKFGSVCWMTQNLRSTYTWQGNQKQELKEDSNVENDYNAVSYYYPGGVEKIEDNPSAYGLLYTWGAANIGTATTEATNAFPNKTSDRQGICPEGWAVPSDYDWNQLEKEIATHPEFYSTQKTAWTWSSVYETTADWRPDSGNANLARWGRSMKSSTAVTVTPNGVSKDDGTGFNVLLVGTLVFGAASYYGTDVLFWSGSTASSATVAWRRHLHSGTSGVGRTTTNKYNLFSVRCKKI
jgi:uncharacterized protein (TIGR02145 family)